MTFDFKTQSKVGKAGQQLFLLNNPLFQPVPGPSTAIVSPCGTKIALKSEKFNLAQTPNFFIERFSDNSLSKPGGPWEALENGYELYIHWFPENLTAFLFDTKELIVTVEALSELYKEPVYIPNRNHTTMGYKIKRKYLRKITALHEF